MKKKYKPKENRNHLPLKKNEYEICRVSIWSLPARAELNLGYI
jgi:hypothetical protein